MFGWSILNYERSQISGKLVFVYLENNLDTDERVHYVASIWFKLVFNYECVTEK